MVAEATQLLGMDGVYAVKSWLESTTHIDLPFNAYENPVLCTVALLNGTVKRFDLAGHFLGKHRRPLLVEAKAYSTPGHQGTEYVKYLAIAYSATAKEVSELGSDSGREFMWVTSHPFSQTAWKTLLSRRYIKAALKAHPNLLAGVAVDDALVESLADRLWILVKHVKQEKLLLTKDELLKVYTVLERKG